MNDFYLKECGVQKLRAWLELLKVRMDNGYINTVEYCCASLFVISLHLSYSVRLNRIEHCFWEKKKRPYQQKAKKRCPCQKKRAECKSKLLSETSSFKILVYFTAM